MALLAPLNAKLLRDLWQIRGQAAAIALVVGCGLTVLIMSLGVVASLVETRAAYYDRYRFADLFATVKRAPERIAERLSEIPGVAAVQTRVVQRVTLDIPGFAEPATGQLVSLPEEGQPRLNAIVLRQGRWLSRARPDDVIVGEAFADAHDLVPGDRFHAVVNGRRRQLTVAGIALAPEFIYAIGPGMLMPDDRRFAVIWMGRAALEAAFDLDGAFNDLVVKLGWGASDDAVIAAIDRLLARYGGTGAYARKDQISHWFLDGEIEQLRTMATILPTIFLLVAAFLLNIVIKRLIALERTQIGLLKAFGYSDLAVGWHYVKLVLVLTGLGLVLGSAGGIAFGRWMTEVYAEFYRFPILYYRLSPDAFAVAAAVSVAAALAGTLSAVRAAARLSPAEAMHPPAPTRFRRTRLARSRIGNWLDQPTRMIARHLVRWPLRTAMGVLGMAMATGLLVTAMNWPDSVAALIEAHYFETERQDMTVAFVENMPRRAYLEIARMPGVLAAEPYRAVPVRYSAGGATRRDRLVGLVADARLSVARDMAADAPDAVIDMPESGLVLSTKLAQILGVGRGDSVTVDVLSGRRPSLSLTVAATYETYIGTPGQMRIEALNRALGEGPVISGAYLRVDAAAAPALFAALKSNPSVSGVMVRRAAVDSFENTMGETIYVIVGLYVFFGFLIAFGIVYNSARIALSERERELASLRVMGFTKAEISYILLGEVAATGALSLPVGCVIGYGLAALISTSFETDLYRVPLTVSYETYAAACGVTLAALVAAGVLVARRVATLDLIAVMKTRE